MLLYNRIEVYDLMLIYERAVFSSQSPELTTSTNIINLSEYTNHIYNKFTYISQVLYIQYLHQ